MDAGWGAINVMLSSCLDYRHKVLEALHLVQVTSTKVVVMHPIASSIHITDCHDCWIEGKSQQLRIHGSQNLSISVDLVAGAIIEGSQDIVFQRMVEVKDFDWLREGMPSPNFRFSIGGVQEESKIEDMCLAPKEREIIASVNLVEPAKHVEMIPAETSAVSLPETMTLIAPVGSPVSPNNNSSEGGDEDDEDEL